METNTNLAQYIKKIDLLSLRTIEKYLALNIPAENGNYWSVEYWRKSCVKIVYKLYKFGNTGHKKFLKADFSFGDDKQIAEYLQSKVYPCKKCNAPSFEEICKACKVFIKIELFNLPQEKCAICRDDFKDETSADVVFLKCCDNKQVLHRHCLMNLAEKDKICYCKIKHKPFGRYEDYIDDPSCTHDILIKCPFHPSEYLALNFERSIYDNFFVEHHKVVMYEGTYENDAYNSYSEEDEEFDGENYEEEEDEDDNTEEVEEDDENEETIEEDDGEEEHIVASEE